MDRRRFLGTLPAAALAGRGLSGFCAMPDEAVEGALARLPDGYGVQLYTLRSVIPSDIAGTLETLASIGYSSVEFAGLYDLTPREMRAELDAVGLAAASSHHGVQDLRGNWSAILEGARELGQDLVVVPSIPGDERGAEELRRVADDFNRAADAARAAGLRFGYHNHDWEFAPLPDGTLPMDLLLDRTDASLVDWQMDVFWTVHGGADPVQRLTDTAGRVTSVHVKDRTPDGRMVDVGDGVIDFAGVLAHAQRLGLLHAFVEHDSPDDALASVRRSYTHLAALRP